VENGTEGHEKWLAKLPQKVENELKLTTGYDSINLIGEK
jgi:hypothetical protein